MGSKKLKKRSSAPDEALPSEIVAIYKKDNFNWSINTDYLDEKHIDFSLFRSLKEFKEIIKKLNSYRTWKWTDIERSHNGLSTGIMDISKLDVKGIVADHLEFIKKIETDQLYKIEINNHHRIWGIREGSCLFLIWNDPEHRFYKHNNANYTPKKLKTP